MKTYQPYRKWFFSHYFSPSSVKMIENVSGLTWASDSHCSIRTEKRFSMQQLSEVGSGVGEPLGSTFCPETLFMMIESRVFFLTAFLTNAEKHFRLATAVNPKDFARLNFWETFRRGRAIIFATFFQFLHLVGENERRKRNSWWRFFLSLSLNLIFLPHYSTKLNVTSRALFAPHPQKKRWFKA